MFLHCLKQCLFKLSKGLGFGCTYSRQKVERMRAEVHRKLLSECSISRTFASSYVAARFTKRHHGQCPPSDVNEDYQ